MRVRCCGSSTGAYSLVQEQRAATVAFVFHEGDEKQCRQTGPGQFFRPQGTPTGSWLQVDDFTQSPTWDNLMGHVDNEEEIARGLIRMPLTETTSRGRHRL